jgi:hypothetical protein
MPGAGIFHGVEKKFPRHGKIRPFFSTLWKKFPRHGKKVSTPWKIRRVEKSGAAA